ncbi:hypothetical protein BY458DRAFT_527840 [Sporodiniella umbellata]|nr:hypothetical protein BY458DRAFT_527840 [Sporodiniella umbellata]
MKLENSSIFLTVLIVLFQCSVVFAQNPTGIPLSPTTNSDQGFDASGNMVKENQESWLKQHNRFVFIIIIALFFVALLIWYIARSIRGMRQRLAQDNQQNMTMLQNSSGRTDISETITVPSDSFHKLPDYSSQKVEYTHRY